VLKYLHKVEIETLWQLQHGNRFIVTVVWCISVLKARKEKENARVCQSINQSVGTSVSPKRDDICGSRDFRS